MASEAARSPNSRPAASSAAGGPPRQRPHLRRPLHERLQFLRGAGGRELLLRLDAEPPDDPVGVAVEQPDEPACEPREQQLRTGDPCGDGPRAGDREVLGDQLPEHHLQGRRQHERRRHGDARCRGLPEPERSERSPQQGRQRWLGQVADDQRGHRDAQLRTRQLGRQGAQGGEHPLGGAVAALGGVGHPGPVDRDEAELGGDEQGVCQQHHDGEREQHPGGRHGAGPRVGGGVVSMRPAIVARRDDLMPLVGGGV
jgi:hypothetical protein